MRFIVLAVVLTVVPAAPAAALECIAIPLETSTQFADIVLLGRIEAVRFSVPSQDAPVRRIVTVSVKHSGKVCSQRNRTAPAIRSEIAWTEPTTTTLTGWTVAELGGLS